MENVNFIVKECDKEQKPGEVCVALVLENNGEKDLYFSRDSLFLDGFTAPRKFTILGYPEVVCRIHSVHYRPEKVLLAAGRTVTSELNLAEVCDFGARGKHTIQFRGHIMFDTDKDDEWFPSEILSGEVEIDRPVTLIDLVEPAIPENLSFHKKDYNDQTMHPALTYTMFFGSVVILGAAIYSLGKYLHPSNHKTEVDIV